uniref:Wsv207 n=2 Tax=White spot syndrome virus TaxID=342409 RepID=A0A2U9G9V0_WSSV|nr:wsv207 [Shrimp white spot syndrome virus]AWQ60793.1 wsv207 [Shrimp white spot syndrome virus]
MSSNRFSQLRGNEEMVGDYSRWTTVKNRRNRQQQYSHSFRPQQQQQHQKRTSTNSPPAPPPPFPIISWGALGSYSMYRLDDQCRNCDETGYYNFHSYDRKRERVRSLNNTPSEGMWRRTSRSSPFLNKKKDVDEAPPPQSNQHMYPLNKYSFREYTPSSKLVNWRDPSQEKQDKILQEEEARAPTPTPQEKEPEVETKDDVVIEEETAPEPEPEPAPVPDPDIPAITATTTTTTTVATRHDDSSTVFLRNVILSIVFWFLGVYSALFAKCIRSKKE